MHPRVRMLTAICHLGVAGLAERVAQPFKSFVKTIARSSAGRLDVLYHPLASCAMQWPLSTYPGSLSETVQTKLVGDFGSVHGIL